MHASSLSCGCGSTYIIVLEQDKPLATAISTALWAHTGKKPIIATTTTEALTHLHDHQGEVFAAAVGINHPAANTLLEKLMENNLPAITFGEEFEETMRQKLTTLGIADILIGERNMLPEAVGQSMATLAKNRDMTILVVDDSRSMRAALQRFLVTRCYRLLEAEDGVQALEVLAAHPEIKLVITDNEMPNMDGFSLIKEIRRTHSKDDLVVIGISAKTSPMLSVRFINNGANDFLHKPFQKEELYCRVDHNLEMLRRIETIRDLSYKDSLTRLYNRRYFFENAEPFIEQATQKGQSHCVAMLDIDHFKKVNDTYGHDGGDEVLKAVSTSIDEHFSDNAIVSRFGGEEFCVLLATDLETDMVPRFDTLRQAIEDLSVEMENQTIRVTISTGLCCEPDKLQSMLKLADSRLYTAKETGRNRIVGPPPSPNIRDARR